MLNSLTTKKNIRTFSLSAENPTGEKGSGGRAKIGEGIASSCAEHLGEGWKVNPNVKFAPGERKVIADITGEGAIKHMWFTDSARSTRHLILRIYFDGQARPAVEAPMADFFCSADTGDYRQLTSLPICVNPAKGMNSYFEMPYFKGFRIELENRGADECFVYYQIDCEEKKLDPDALYFHAQFRHVNPLPFKEVYTILDNVKGTGHYVGTYLHWGVKSNGWWGEGEIKFYLDGDVDYPTICGTGTEDYFGGAYNFDVGGQYREFCTPYAGMSKVGRTDGTYTAQRFFDLYRFHIVDPVYFTENIRVTIQALGWYKDWTYRPLQDEISSVAYWYSDHLEDEYPALPESKELDF